MKSVHCYKQWLWSIWAHSTKFSVSHYMLIEVSKGSVFCFCFLFGRRCLVYSGVQYVLNKVWSNTASEQPNFCDNTFACTCNIQHKQRPCHLFACLWSRGPRYFTWLQTFKNLKLGETTYNIHISLVLISSGDHHNTLCIILFSVTIPRKTCWGAAAGQPSSN